MDFGFIHCIDQQAELDKALQGGILEMVQKYKQQGKVWHIGFSSHNPAMVHKVLDIHIVDMVMFSINPAYDYTDKEEYGIGTAGERMALYRRCEQEGVGISVMKPYGGGRPPPPNPDRGSASECSRIPLQNIRYTPGQTPSSSPPPLSFRPAKSLFVTSLFGKNMKIAMRTRIRTKRDEISTFCARYRSLLCIFHTHLFRQGTAVHTGNPRRGAGGFPPPYVSTAQSRCLNPLWC